MLLNQKMPDSSFAGKHSTQQVYSESISRPEVLVGRERHSHVLRSDAAAT
jgi:hypothetical protein